MSGLLSKVFRRNVVARKLPVNIQKRQMSGNLVTNVRVEENSGLREISYWTWEFSATSVARIIGYFIIPSTVFYQLATMELEKRNEMIGRKGVKTGLLPHSPERE